MRDMPNLDFVRALAVITVVLEHTLLGLGIQQVGPFPVAYLGVLGVLVFFVLTTLVLMWSLERRPHTLDFYIRRFFRIYPLALTVLAIAVLFRAPTGGTPQNIFLYAYPHARDLLMQATLLPLTVPTSSYVLGVMWSLPYEVEMYILLPLVFFFVRRNFSLWPLLLVWTLVFLNTRTLPPNGHNFAVSIDYFLPGVMAYVGFGRWKQTLPAWLLPIFLLALWPIFLYHCNFHKGWWFCLIIGLTLPMFRQMKSEILLAPSRQIAKYSYGVYLTHLFAIVIGIHFLRDHSIGLRLLVEAVLLVVFPVLAYHLVEHPMIRVGSRLAAKAEKRYEQREMEAFHNLPAA